jgi:arsenite methyltransferase
MAERAFAEKLERVGLQDVSAVERRWWGIGDCARYPLFDEGLIALMRRVLPSGTLDRVATVVTFVGGKPAAA